MCNLMRQKFQSRRVKFSLNFGEIFYHQKLFLLNRNDNLNAPFSHFLGSASRKFDYEKNNFWGFRRFRSAKLFHQSKSFLVHKVLQMSYKKNNNQCLR